MKEDLRGLIERLEKAGEVARVRKEVDPRYISALVAKSPKAMVFERVRGYEMAMVGGLITTRRRQALSLGVGEAEVGLKFLHAMDNRIDPVIVKESPAQEVVHTGSQVDLTSLPIPLLHRKDGGPYITTGIVVAKDYKGRRNAGMYRLMYRTPTETGIDLVSPSDLRFIYQRALEEGKALPVAVAMGCHPAEMFATSYKAPPGEDEFSVAGGLRGEPVELVACKTVELEVPASAEVVLEGELLPVGWTVDEGGFGDFTGHQCTIRWNPIFRVKAITRNDPAYPPRLKE
ncbi:MAG: UbiD family decarboxylase domain-containing protein, partial [Nitrospinota bacterium]